MPLFGRYLIKNYLKVFSLAVFSFIAILLVTRLEEIAQIAAMGTGLSFLTRFTLLQIPYILPIAIPISSLIAAFLLFQRLSHSHELTALRTGGLSLFTLITPLLITAAFLGCATFYTVSELATASHVATRKMVYEMTSVNPLLLLQNAKIARLQNAFVQMDPIKNGENARHLVIAFLGSPSKRLHLCLADTIHVKKQTLTAQTVSLITSAPLQDTSSPDHLVIENQRVFHASAPECAHLLRKGGWKMATDHLSFRLLRLRQEQWAEHIAKDSTSLKYLRSYHKCQSEMLRRLSCGLATFTFTLLGIACGMEIGRHRRLKGILTVLGLTALSFIAFFAGKELDHLVAVAALCFFLPHLLMLLFSVWTLSRLNRGVE